MNAVRWLFLSLGVLVSARVSAQMDVTSKLSIASPTSITTLSGPSVGPTQVSNYGKLPLSFEANQGQSDPQVRFLSHGNGYSLFLTNSEAVLSLRRRGNTARDSSGDSAHVPIKADVIRMQLAGANPAVGMTGSAPLPGTANYFIGNNPAKWYTNVRTYERVRYTSVYRGVDLVFYGNQQQLEYDFVVGPDADPGAIRLRFAGTKKLKLNSNGDLEVIAKNGEIAFHKPVVYQEIAGERRQVDGHFMLAAGNTVGFSLGDYDHAKPVTIDPVLAYSTYLGGSGYHIPAGPDCCGDYGTAIAADNNGGAYVAGYTGSSDFPLKNPYQRQNNDPQTAGVAFVARLNAAGSALIYSTYLGGSGNYWYKDAALGIAVDAYGDAFITGYTGSYQSLTTTGFPVTTGAYQQTNKAAANAGRNAFVTKLSPDGSTLLYSTYLGGSGFNNGVFRDGDYAAGIALDAAGDAFVAGTTVSTDFPHTSGVVQPQNNAQKINGTNLFVSKLSSDGSTLVYSTYLGGTGISTKDFSGADYGTGIAVDVNGDAYVIGYAHSKDYPRSSQPYQNQNNAHNSLNGTGASDTNAVVTKLNFNGTQLIYSTYLGGSGNPYYGDEALGIAVDSLDQAFVVGHAASTDFPYTSGVLQETTKASPYGYSGFVTKFNSDGTDLLYSTFLGGTPLPGARQADETTAVALHSENAYITGTTYANDFPVTPNAFQNANKQSANGGANYYSGNAFMTELSDDASALVYSTFLGGSGAADGSGGDRGLAIAVDPSGNAYVTGSTLSKGFPTTTGAFQTLNNAVQAGNPDSPNAFVLKIGSVSTATLIATDTTVVADASTQKQGVNITFTADVQPGSGTGIPVGSVAFSIDGSAAVFVTLDDTGHASYATSSLTPGKHTVTARFYGDVDYLSSNDSTSVKVVGPPVLIANLSGSKQTSTIGAPFANPLVAVVQDAEGNPVSGVLVSLSGPGLEFSPNPATTGSNGEASVIATPTAAGGLTATASVAGLSGTATFSLAATEPTSVFGYHFIPVAPCRVADTRNPIGTFGGPELGDQSTRDFEVSQSACNIPSTAVAYSINITAVPNGPLGYLTIWPAGQSQPNISTLNSDGRVKANAAIVPAGINGAVSVYVSDATNVILDIDGYFVPAGSSTSALVFYPLTSCRIADTRNAAGSLGGPSINGGSSRSFPILSSSCGIPSNVAAYSLNVTAIPHNTLNYLTTWPTGTIQPNVSTLNAPTGTVVANAAIVPAGTNGAVSVFVSDTSDVILDIDGYFAPPAAGGLSLYPVAPCRVIDTRPTAFNGLKAVNVEGSSCAPPSAAQAYVLNATVVPPGALDYLTLWPAGATQPGVSTLNALDGAITSNMAIVPTNNGSIDAFAYSPTNLILDISSYFAP